MSDTSTTVPEKVGATEQSKGVTSSKRITGIPLVALGAGLLLATGLVALFRTTAMPNASIAIQAGLAIAGLGTTLLGLTVIDNKTEAVAKSESTGGGL